MDYNDSTNLHRTRHGKPFRSVLLWFVGVVECVGFAWLYNAAQRCQKKPRFVDRVDLPMGRTMLAGCLQGVASEKTRAAQPCRSFGFNVAAASTVLGSLFCVILMEGRIKELLMPVQEAHAAH